jgi:hypothetical protein
MTGGSVGFVVRGDASNRTPGDPGDESPGRPGAQQREVLARFEAAIAGMDTRQIQLGLRQLLGQPGRDPAHVPAAGKLVAGRTREADVTCESVETSGSRGAAEADGEADRQPAPAGTAFRDRPWADLDDMPGPVARLLAAVRTPSARRQMERLISQAGLGQTGPVDTATAARMVRPYSWLLEWVGDDGIKLTDAGHLPPAQVAAVIGALDLAAEGITHVSRENHAPPVLRLRESAQATGLVRKTRGRLVLTTRGAALRHDPPALWWHLAGELPLRSAAVSEAEPGMILLACVAARFTDTLDITIARMLTAMGWMNGAGSPLTGAEATAATSGTHAVLRRLGVLPCRPADGFSPWPPPEGVAFTRAALCTWPAPG